MPVGLHMEKEVNLGKKITEFEPSLWRRSKIPENQPFGPNRDFCCFGRKGGEFGQKNYRV